MDQIDGPVVADPRRVRLLGKENNVGGVEQVHTIPPQIGHPHDGGDHIALDNLPA